ncbi:MAG: glycosyltransferase family 2 protein [Epsilonproteobacteria bacterium]|nr:glycosyltransferase family 2 protein [Campylobacterota bacterium]
MISAVILTKNSQKYLKEVLESVAFCDEVIIYDSGSEDDTIEIAKSYSNTVIQVDTNWQGFGKHKQKAVDLASNEWVFVLDSDEVVTKELQQEILLSIQNAQFDAYKVPRLNNFFGKWIKHGGLYPDYSIRLFKKDICFFNDRVVHEAVECNNTGVLRSHFLHYAYDTVDEFIAKQNKYSSLFHKSNKLKAVFSPFWTFFRMYILKMGFLDGWEGFVIARLYSQYTFWKYIKKD